MSYSCRPGLVLTKICGLWLIIPTREAYEYCPEAVRMSLPAVFVWGLLQKHAPREKMLRVLQILTHKEDEEVSEMLQSMLDSFLSRNMILAVEEEP